MTSTTRWYGKGLASLANKEIDFNSDAIKGALVTSSYTFDQDAHDYFNDITNEVIGTGYTAGGAAVGSPSLAYVAANSWAKSRANSTAYVLSEVVRPASGNGFLYQVIVAGTGAGSPPTYPTTIGGTVTDGSITWLCVARGGLVLDGNDLTWATSTITARGCVIYDSTPGTSSTNPLICFIDNGADVSTTAGTFTVPFDSTGIAFILVS